jgi:hypothetical protein
MEKRYQVFVSSTYQDLQEERQEVMHALLELDCIPSGMELFPAANETQWSLIKSVIDDCDYYVLILGGRYGSIGPEGISYTEMEYRYAMEKGKPTIAFIHENPGAIPTNKSENTDEGRQRLNSFREIVGQKMFKHWSTPENLGSVVSRSLIQLIKAHPAVGWVRADELPDREASLELLRLRKEVDELTAELQQARTTAPKGTESLAQGEDQFQIDYSFSYGENRFFPHASLKISWNSIFANIAPEMIHEMSEMRLKLALSSMIANSEWEELSQSGFSGIHDFDINESDFQTIKIQLRALGLIVRSEKARSVKDTETYWTLTPYGDQVMTRLRAIKRKTVDDSPQETGTI